MAHFHSEIYDGDLTYNVASRQKKAKKLLAILKDYLRTDTKKLSLLEVGCAGGMITDYLSKSFKTTVGVDVDVEAVERAIKTYSNKNLSFQSYPGKKLPFKDASFDVMIVNQVYEHVEDVNILMSEIYRVMKPEGCCLMGAGNRLVFIDVHYPKLPLVSIIPVPLANLYVKITKQGDFYEPRLLYTVGIQKLVSKFKVTDYTLKVIKNPKKFEADDVIKPGSFLNNLPEPVLNLLYFLIPNYLLVLHK